MSAPLHPEAPAAQDDWPALAATAAQLLADRRRRDPADVESGSRTAKDADARARVARSLTALWRAVIAREPIPDLPATHAEIRADLAEASRLARQRAGRRPDPAVAELAAKVEALAWHHRPAWDGADLPVIAFLHGCNQAARQIARANAAVREAATVRLPERPAPRQKALFG